jgi:GWxTD domain-containing protein
MKNLLLILLSISSLLSCKVHKKTELNQEPFSKTITKLSRPVVSSISAKYVLIDSANVRIFAKAEISHVPEEMTFKDLNDFFRIQWTLQNEYGAKEKLKTGRLVFTNEFFKREGNTFWLAFNVPKIKNTPNAVLILDFIDNEQALKYTNDLPIDFTGQRIDTRYTIFMADSTEFPSFQPFIQTGKPFVIKPMLKNAENLYLKRYKNKSLPALSPMSASKRDILSEYELDTTLTITSGQTLKLDLEGLYMLTQKPDAPDDGYSFLVVDNRFPRLTSPDEIRDALVYMSTPKEIDQLKSTENAKDAIDLYLLKVCNGDQNQAKQIVKSYYKRIENANQLFSTHKEGWKTDKGMVFVIMGPPTKVQRNKQREVWLYSQNQNNSEIIFTFYRKATIFSDQNYELVRYPEYSSFWYPYVEAWRTGNVVE